MIENALIKRRLELLSQGKSRKLSMAEAQELKTILQKELRQDFAVGKFGVLAFLILEVIIDKLPEVLGSAA